MFHGGQSDSCIGRQDCNQVSEPEDSSSIGWQRICKGEWLAVALAFDRAVGNLLISWFVGAMSLI